MFQHVFVIRLALEQRQDFTVPQLGQKDGQSDKALLAVNDIPNSTILSVMLVNNDCSQMKHSPILPVEIPNGFQQPFNLPFPPAIPSLVIGNCQNGVARLGTADKQIRYIHARKKFDNWL